MAEKELKINITAQYDGTAAKEAERDFRKIPPTLAEIKAKLAENNRLYKRMKEDERDAAVLAKRAAQASKEAAAAAALAAKNQAGIFSKMTKGLGDLNKGFGQLKTLFAGFIGVQVLKSFADTTINAVKATMDLADSLVNLSAEGQVSVKWLQEMKFATTGTNVTVEDLSKSMAKLNKNIGEAAAKGGPVRDLFEDIGITLEDLRSNNPEEIFDKIVDVFPTITSETDKARVAMTLFGRSGTELIPILNKGRDGLEELRKKAKELGLVMSDVDANNLAEAKKQFQLIGQQIQYAFADIVVKNLGSINELITTLSKTIKDPAFISALETYGAAIGIAAKAGAGILKIPGILVQAGAQAISPRGEAAARSFTLSEQYKMTAAQIQAEEAKRNLKLTKQERADIQKRIGELEKQKQAAITQATYIARLQDPEELKKLAVLARVKNIRDLEAKKTTLDPLALRTPEGRASFGNMLKTMTKAGVAGAGVGAAIGSPAGPIGAGIGALAGFIPGAMAGVVLETPVDESRLKDALYKQYEEQRIAQEKIQGDAQNEQARLRGQLGIKTEDQIREEKKAKEADSLAKKEDDRRTAEDKKKQEEEDQANRIKTQRIEYYEKQRRAAREKNAQALADIDLKYSNTEEDQLEKRKDTVIQQTIFDSAMAKIDAEERKQEARESIRDKTTLNNTLTTIDENYNSERKLQLLKRDTELEKIEIDRQNWQADQAEKASEELHSKDKEAKAAALDAERKHTEKLQEVWQDRFNMIYDLQVKFDEDNKAREDAKEKGRQQQKEDEEDELKERANNWTRFYNETMNLASEWGSALSQAASTAYNIFKDENVPDAKKWEEFWKSMGDSLAQWAIQMGAQLVGALASITAMAGVAAAMTSGAPNPVTFGEAWGNLFRAWFGSTTVGRIASSAKALKGSGTREEPPVLQDLNKDPMALFGFFDTGGMVNAMRAPGLGGSVTNVYVDGNVVTAKEMYGNAKQYSIKSDALKLASAF